MTVYNDTDFSKGKFIFEAIFDIVVNLKSPLTYYSEAEKAKIIALNNNIQSLELSCENREPLIPESCVEYGTKYPEYVALLFNEDDCILKDRSKPVLLKSGERLRVAIIMAPNILLNEYTSLICAGKFLNLRFLIILRNLFHGMKAN